MSETACVRCDPKRQKRELRRTTVWDSAAWRLSNAGAEAASLGPTIARVIAASEDANGTTIIRSPDVPPRPDAKMPAAADAVRARLR